MKFFKPTKIEVLVFQAILIFFLAILYLFTPYPSNTGLIISYSVLLSTFTYISGWIIGVNKNGNGLLDFLKILLPTSGTLIAAVWLLSSGYLNLKAENLKTEINTLGKQKSSLQVRISKFEKDSIRLVKENDSVFRLNKFLESQISNNSGIEILNATLNIENKKLNNENNLLKNNNNLLKSENRVLKSRTHIMRISNINKNKREVSFTIKDQRGRLLDINKLGLSWRNRDSSEREYPNPRFDKQSKKYLWQIPADLLHSELSIELGFSFPKSTILSYEEEKRFRKNNKSFYIDPFSAEYELIVYIY